MRYDVPTLREPAATEGDSVTLRAHAEDDVEAVYEQCTDPVSQAWTTVPVPYTRDQAKRFVREAMPGGWATDQEWAFAVDVGGRFAGTVSLRNEGEGRAEIAYGSHPAVRGTGVMERALRLLLAWGFEERGLRTVIWWANRGNWASRKLAWRLGFAVEGPVRQWLPQRGELLDAWVGTLLATDERQPATTWLVPPVVESPRLPLRLRGPLESDAQRIMEACRDPETRFWLSSMPDPYTEQDAASFVERRLERMAAGELLQFAVAGRDDDRLLATVSLFGIDRELASVEVGYWAHPAERGRGVMTEAVRLAVRHALLPEEDGGLGLNKAYAYAAIPNVASRTVLHRAGLAEAGLVRMGTRTRDGLTDAMRYEVCAADLGLK